jgi:hypothetical protein
VRCSSSLLELAEAEAEAEAELDLAQRAVAYVRLLIGITPTEAD